MRTRRRRSRAPYRNRYTGWFHDHFGWFLRMSRKKQILLLAAVTVATLLIIAFITIVVFAASLSSKESIMNRNKTGVVLVDRNDKTLYRFHDAQTETYVTLKDISLAARQAVIAAEDQDFYEHPGFSLTGIINAVYENIRPGGNDRGGSTLTQQLAKNALLTEERSFLRKYQELVLSLEIERRYTKDEILEMYMNSAYFGEGTFGIEDAAKAYFNKSAKDLNLAEATLLAGLLPAPSAYSPISGSLKLAKERQNYVLDRMQEDGYISQAQMDTAFDRKLAYNKQRQDPNLRAPHFALMVKEELEERYGEEQIARSGYVVRTTLNLDWQEKAETALRSQLDVLAGSNVSNGSVVAVDPKTGQILALVGSRDWDNNEFGKVNMAISPRQPGSSFKPLVYGTGIEEGTLTAATILHDKPTDFGGGYRPQNYDGRFRGNVTLRRALANSLNVPAVEALDMVGISDVIQTARDLGVTTLTEGAETYGLSLALGTGPVKLTELTNAYATFANQGERHDLQTILSIADKNERIIFRADNSPSQAVSDETSYIISSILSDNSARAETFGGSLSLFDGRSAAVKTGTTDDYRDALTVGYTPSLAVGVWMGNNDNSPMSTIAGSVGSAPVWRQLMYDILAGTPFEEFEQPFGVVAAQVCRNSGALAATAGTNTYTEYFRGGILPNETCNARQEPETPPAKPEEEEPDPEEEEPEEEQPPEEEEPTPPDEDEDPEDPTLPVDPPISP